jgi:hypothetical protein
MSRFTRSATFAVVALVVAETASASALFWNKVITTQRTYEGCMRSARRNSLVNVRISRDEVSGTSLDGKVYVAITCVGRGADQRAVAFIAGVGEDAAWVRQVVKATAEEVRTAGVPD